MYYLGIDIGSMSCDAIIIDRETNILASTIVPTGSRNLEAIERATREVLDEAHLQKEDIRHIVSTGYGRERVEGRTNDFTEIACHARGIQKYFPTTELLIDIGGQDSKAICITPKGKVSDFTMNDKCAAGTGRFLEAMARALEVDIEEFASLDLGAQGSQNISSMCTVFAESEVVSLVAQGVEIREIANGINRSIASRTYAMAKKIAPQLEKMNIAMSGGVARNEGVIRTLRDQCKNQIHIPPEPDLIGALGAALYALDEEKASEN